MKKENMIFRLKMEIASLVNEMVSKLPETLFLSDSTTFLDPSMASGQYVAAIEQRLRTHGHSDENIKSRVFGVEKNMLRVNYAIKKNKLVGTYSVDKNDVPSILICNMKFDCIVGNPPYQNGTDKNSGSSDKLWMEFVKKSILSLEKNGYMCIVHPIGWRTIGNEMWKEVYQKIQVEYCKIEPHVDWGVGIKVDWYIIRNTDYTIPTEVEFKDKTKIIDFRKVSGIVGDSTVEKLLNCGEDTIDFHQSHSHDSRRDFISKSESSTNTFPLRHTTPNNLLWSSKSHKWQNEKKVLVSNSGYLYPTYDDGVYGTTQACWVVFVKSKIDGEYLVRLLNSKLFTYFINNVKTSGYNNKLLKLLPYPKGLSDNFTNADLYAHFKLTDDEIKLVESAIKD